MAISSGSWSVFGQKLPEFGITERLGGLVGAPRTAQGGSNLFGSPRPQASTGQTLGVQTNSGPIARDTGTFIGPILPQNQLNGGGGGGGGGGNGGGITGGQPIPYETAPGSPEIDFNSYIQPALDALDQAIGPLQSQYDASVAQIEGRSNKAKADQQTYIQGQEKDAQSSRARQTQVADDAQNEARRAFSEIQQGIQSQYGGTTGTGAFATEIAGRQTLQNMGQVRQNLSNAIGEIDNRLSQVKEIGKVALQDIEDKANEQKLQAKADLENNLNQIRLKKGELQSRKAEMVAQAIQNYQGILADIGARNAQFSQQLYLRQQEAEQQLASARTRAADVAKQYSTENLTANLPGLLKYGSIVQQNGYEPTFSQNIPGGGQVSFGLPKKQEDENASVF